MRVRIMPRIALRAEMRLSAGTRFETEIRLRAGIILR